MPDWLRRAGVLRLEDGRVVTWTVSEGRRGRRWREAVTKPDQPGIRHSLLLETDPAGWFVHLELSTEAGLLTLHPEPDGTLHGNAVTANGVEHIRGRPWDPHAVVLVDGSVLSRLAALHGLASTIDVGATLDVPTVRIPRSLAVLPDRERFRRERPQHWAIGELERLALADDGLFLAGSGTTWPLEASD